MKRVWVVVLSLGLLASTAGVAAADPSATALTPQQAVQIVIKRALSQVGVPFTYGGGDASGPTRRPATTPAPAVVPTVPAVPAVPAAPGLGVPGLGVPGVDAEPLASQDAPADTVGFDASGLVVYAFAGVGLKLPRSSGEQYKVAQKVLPSQALPGDLIFFGPEGSQSVALFIGNGQMVEGTEPSVTVSKVRTSGMTPYVGRIIRH